ncbi:MAG: hypothetical protein DMG56_14955 [Acidobacteria bacterium]|nr:MAG: hypothetical protein DMG56_14955 [Acidobacteriota bacterium]
MVQIHSPRPFLLEPATYNTRKAEERLVQNQEVCVQISRMKQETLFPAGLEVSDGQMVWPK